MLQIRFHLLQLSSFIANPFSFIASVNPNILNHCDAMRAHDRESFEDAMHKKVAKMQKEEIFEEVSKSEVPNTQHDSISLQITLVLHRLWSLRLKIKNWQSKNYML